MYLAYLLDNAILYINISFECLVVIHNLAIFDIDAILGALQVYGHFFNWRRHVNT